MATQSGETATTKPIGVSDVMEGTPYKASEMVFFPGHSELIKWGRSGGDGDAAFSGQASNVVTALAGAGYRAASGNRRTDPALMNQEDPLVRNPFLRRFG